MVVLGQGSYGIVLSNPRLPISNESYDEIINLNHVSKLLYDIKYDKNKRIYIPCSFEDFEYEYTSTIILLKDYSKIFTNEHFMLPLKAGIIDKWKFVNKYNNNDKNYNYEWLSKSNENIKIINELIKNQNDIYQIIYEKGDKVSSDINIFYNGIKNIFEAIKITNESGFFFDDIKLENLVLHDNKIKMIDFSCPINTNLSYDKIIKQIVNSKFKTIYYFPYNTLINITLYENINQIKQIGDIGIHNNYYSLLYSNLIEFESNVKYKLTQIQKLLYLADNYFQDYYVEIKLINYNFIHKIKSIKDINIYEEIKKINLIDFSSSVLQFLLYSNNNLENNKDNIIVINEIFIKYKELVNVLFPDEKDSNEKIIFLLKNINIYSFGFIFVDWILKNIKSKTDINLIKDKLVKIFNIIIHSCSNYITLDNDLYFSFPSLNMNNINYFFNDTI
jgi:hypothetical protein